MQVAVIAIGRNEGPRLARCLASASRQAAVVVYVDSNSSDRSVDVATDLGAEVVALDPARPFTAARARNAGVARARQMGHDPDFYQFVDGDCEMADGWIGRALAEFARRPEAGVVCGRRRERHPGATVYNKMCDLEWDTPVGRAKACGGDAMFRAGAFDEAGGYDGSVIAGEEPELCVRLRRRGWEVWRVDAEMTLHDAAMTRLGQWWRRNVRAGHAYAEGHHLHGGPPERHFAKQVRSNAFWGIAVPAGVVALAVGLAFVSRWLAPLALLPVAGYGVLAWRVYRHRIGRGDVPADARAYAGFTVLGKFAQAWGQATFWINRQRGRRSGIIEYKAAAPAAGPADPVAVG